MVLGSLPVAFALPTFPGVASGCPFQSMSPLSTSTPGYDAACRLKPNHFTWTPPGPGDLRAPCPTLNTLANHGFLPHDGRNITLDIVIKGLKDAMNIEEALATAAFTPALKLNSIPNANYIDLDMLNKHNVIEHDGSLSRRDMYVDPSNRFDKGTFDAFVAYFGDGTMINTTDMANARARHALVMSKMNPTFTLPESSAPLFLGESALMLAVWGSPNKPVANRLFLEYFFRNEKLPVLLGWVPSDTPITSAIISQIANDIASQTPSDVPLTYTAQHS
ncbi:Chloroperoxidase [Colletotrichum godetiae]|uniref:Chloroperoxidase n=1 Tax=Colletotrichum godetiae TaxID=1209918 RepID=A0AAJ0ACG2_9PEZI|nr:Chloroperoxidase [Colletotrichum godetiae]KAK1671373.1 Chloroperoxidase [Colletotrichum godetiae]